MSRSTIAIVGFTGRMSRLIADALLKHHPDVEIHGIARTLAKVDARYQQNTNVKLYKSDATDQATLRRGLKNAGVCICGYQGDETLMIHGQKVLIDACIAEGVARYIASDWSMNLDGLAFGDHPGKDPMKHVAAYLNERKDSIESVHIMNGTFMEVFFSPFLGYYDHENNTFRYYGSGDEPIDITTMEDAAAFTAEVALDKVANGSIQVRSDTKSVKEMAAIWSRVYGTKTRAERSGSLEELKVAMTAARASDAANPFTWMGQYYVFWMQQDSTKLRNVRNCDYPGVKVTTFEEYLKRHTPQSVLDTYMGM